MKIATIGFYYDFTRFFAGFHARITQSGSLTEVTNYATHASGYLFENARGMRRVFLPLAVRVPARGKSSIADAMQAWIGQYTEASGVSAKRARKISRQYAIYFLEAFKRNPPDVVIISGDTRMQSRAAAHACRELGIKHFYFEQGPFGTTIIDPKGVNCTASFANTFLSGPPTESVELDPRNCLATPNTKVAERKVVRALDYFVQPMFLLLGFHEIREEKEFFKQVSRQIWALRKQNATFTDTAERVSEPFVLVVGQVPSDANFSLNSPYSTSLQLIRDVEELFPNTNILFREHPLFIGSYGADFYAHFAANPRLKFSRGTRLDSEIESANNIVVVNSTAGMEVVLKHRKPLLCLGDAAYTHLNGVFNRDRINEYVGAVDYIDDAGHLANCAWFRSSFIPGHFRDKDLQQVTTEALRKIDED